MKMLVVRMSEQDLAKVAAAAPALEVVVARENAEVPARMADVEIYLPGPREPESFAQAEKLRWVHMTWAGVDHSPFLKALRAEVVVTNSAGVFAIPIAEHALALILAFSRGTHFCSRRSREEVWGKGHWQRLQPHLLELGDATLGIVGYGGIGRETARRAKAFGMRVIGQRRHPQPDDFADAVWGPERLDDLLRASDYLLVSAPLTDRTRGLIGARELALMKPNGVIINVARGAIIDQPALVQALQEKRLRGAGLDVTSPEPLPFDSPLWEMENVLITPHVSGSSPRTWQRQFDFFLENLRRYLAGEPLLNVVDREAGY